MSTFKEEAEKKNEQLIERTYQLRLKIDAADRQVVDLEDEGTETDGAWYQANMEECNSEALVINAEQVALAEAVDQHLEEQAKETEAEVNRLKSKIGKESEVVDRLAALEAIVKLQAKQIAELKAALSG